MFRQCPPDSSTAPQPTDARRAPPVVYTAAFAVAPFAAMYAASNPAVAAAFAVVAAVAVASRGRPSE